VRKRWRAIRCWLFGHDLVRVEEIDRTICTRCNVVLGGRNKEE
jgi:hypothetical protein